MGKATGWGKLFHVKWHVAGMGPQVISHGQGHWLGQAVPCKVASSGDGVSGYITWARPLAGASCSM